MHACVRTRYSTGPYYKNNNKMSTNKKPRLRFYKKLRKFGSRYTKVRVRENVPIPK